MAIAFTWSGGGWQRFSTRRAKNARQSNSVWSWAGLLHVHRLFGAHLKPLGDPRHTQSDILPVYWRNLLSLGYGMSIDKRGFAHKKTGPHRNINISLPCDSRSNSLLLVSRALCAQVACSMAVTIESLAIYPIKSCKGIQLQQAEIAATGTRLLLGVLYKASPCSHINLRNPFPCMQASSLTASGCWSDLMASS